MSRKRTEQHQNADELRAQWSTIAASPLAGARDIPLGHSLSSQAMDPVSQLELVCIHEAAHAVLTVNCRWHFLCGAVSVNAVGHGTAPFQMDNAAAKAELLASGNADRVFLKAAIIAAAGVCAENRLRRERRERQLTIDEAFLASSADVDQAKSALSNMVVPTTLGAVVQTTQAAIDSNENMWEIIRQFADHLRESRTLTPQEATDTILSIEQKLSQS